MNRWALVIGGAVANVVESAAMPQVDFGGSWVLVSGGAVAGLGFTWNGAAFAAPSAPVILLSRKQFWKRWTRNERENFEDVRQSGGNAQKRRLCAFAENVSDGDIDLTESYWGNQLSWMEANGSNVLGAGNILAAGRAAQILAG